jgi:hypothetical protein
MHMMRILLVIPVFVSDARHVEMLRVQSLLRDRLKAAGEESLVVWSAAVFDHIDEKFSEAVKDLEKAFDFFVTPSQVAAHSGANSLCGICRPTNYAIDILARNFDDASSVCVLRVIQDTFIMDIGTFVRKLKEMATQTNPRFIAADVLDWETDGHAALCRTMKLPFSRRLQYAYGAVMLAPWPIWERFYLGLPPAIIHYFDDVMMSQWLLHEGGKLIGIGRQFEHMHHCESAVARQVYRTHCEELNASQKILPVEARPHKEEANKTFLVVTPFSRPQNLPALTAMWAKARRGMEGQVRWLAICHDFSAQMPLEGWIESPQVWVSDPSWNICYWKCNEGLRRLGDMGVLNREHFIGFLCDDDTYDEGFFAALNKVVDEAAEVIVVGSRRYGGSPSSFWGILPAAPENVRPCNIGLEQFFVRGDVMRDFQFENHSWADGRLAERLFARNMDGFRYLTETFVNWNILPK